MGLNLSLETQSNNVSQGADEQQETEDGPWGKEYQVPSFHFHGSVHP